MLRHRGGGGGGGGLGGGSPAGGLLGGGGSGAGALLAVPMALSRRMRWVAAGGLGLLLLGLATYARLERQTAASPLASAPRSVGEPLTVLINTFKRPDRLELAVDHYAACAATGAVPIEAIHVVWSESPEAPADAPGEVRGVPVVYDAHPTTSLNNRFRPLKTPRSDAVLSVDDDIRVDCEDLMFALEVWRAAPRAMVGFVARTVSGEPGAFRYRHFWSTYMTGRFSMVLTKVRADASTLRRSH